MPEANLPKSENSLELKESIRAQTLERIGWINELVVELASGDAKLSNVLPEPTAVRDEAPKPNWTSAQEAKAREVGRRFGYGAEQDVSSGLNGALVVAEGGKVWKIMAEAEAIKGEDNPRQIIFAGSPYRQLGEDEITFLKEKQGVDLVEGANEYDAARWVASRQTAELMDEPEVLPFGYAVAEGNALVSEATGQLIKIGETKSGQNVELLRVDREIYEDETGGKKFRYQPDPTRIMELLSESLAASGDSTTPIAFATSNTYASKQVSSIRAGLKNGRQFGVGMYGRQTIGSLGAPVPSETPLNHLPGDLRAMYENLQQLLNELGSSSAMSESKSHWIDSETGDEMARDSEGHVWVYRAKDGQRFQPEWNGPDFYDE